LRGRILVAGAEASDAEILVINAGRVVAALPASPSFEVPAELASSCGELQLLVRLKRPLGVFPATLPASCTGEFTVAVPAERVVVLHGSARRSCCCAPEGFSIRRSQSASE
jgi:hypothetical protein